MKSHAIDAEVHGPWSLAVSRTFWEGFSPNALTGQDPGDELSAVFRADSDWSRAQARVSQQDGNARIVVSGDGDLEAAAAQVCRFLALDVDARGWPAVAKRDPVIADAQRRLPGLRPCGFYSPYEAAAWSVLSQRIRIAQAGALRANLVDQHGDEGAFPAPERLRGLDLDLPGRKMEYLRAVAEAALDGQLDAADLRSADPERALAMVREIKGIGPFAAELIVLRGVNAPDILPRNERRLNAEISERYGPGRSPEEIAAAWRPYRTWGAFHLRATAEAT